GRVGEAHHPLAPRRPARPRHRPAGGGRPMPHQLSEHASRTALLALREMFPHDALPDEPYVGVVHALERSAGADPAVAVLLDEGLAGLDAEAQPFAQLSPEARLALLTRQAGTPFFELLRSTTVVELYDDPAVWQAFGYEGASVHLGGYVERGFDDL